ncbi:MAG: hypothetical protein US89_C0005G0015 [Candidatus Peregrinibacteria bacterium GW2011_GWF2_38_29]|nr:MAG: hypothetical protein US89_C0005G0015 [Candidatus Peregrinibacteria bacterium GW2011_GWF2_38_29]HBB02604.1 hypothetical protein [Candidatus Peregrinibacteria bacterium]
MADTNTQQASQQSTGAVSVIRDGKMLIQGTRGRFFINADQKKIDEIVAKYSIPTSVTSKYPDLIALAIQTESMDDSEREYWYQIMPVMTDDQIVKLRNILVNEKEQLTKLDEEYNQDLKSLNDKHMSEWQDFERKQKRQKMIEAEKATDETEAEHEKKLLEELDKLQNP